MGFLDETIFGFRDATKANEKEKEVMLLLIKEFFDYNKKIGSYLDTLDLNKFDFYFDDATKSDGVMGGYSIIKPYSISVPQYGNQNVVDKCIMALPTALHELNHAYQFGIPIKCNDMFMVILSKVVMPVCYVMNNLITKLIDNRLTTAIMIKIYQMIGKKDVNPDDVHVPFLYKFTIEHDSDKMIDTNKMMDIFVSKLDKCVAGIRYINRQINKLDKVDLNEREEILNGTTRQLDEYQREHGNYFVGLAMKLVDIYDN